MKTILSGKYKGNDFIIQLIHIFYSLEKWQIRYYDNDLKMIIHYQFNTALECFFWFKNKINKKDQLNEN